MLIGFCGHIGAGKTASAKWLYEKGYMHVAFADALRDMTRQVFALPVASVTDQKDRLAAYGKTGRELLVDFGNFCRSIDPQFWVEKLHARISGTGADVAIDDVRFPNEADYVRASGGFLVRVARPGYEPDIHNATEDIAASLVADLYIEATTLTELHDKLGALLPALKVLEDFKHGQPSAYSKGRLYTTERVRTEAAGGCTSLGQGELGNPGRVSGVPADYRARSDAPDATLALPRDEQRNADGAIQVPGPTEERTQQRPPAAERVSRGTSALAKARDPMKAACGPTDITLAEAQQGWGNHVIVDDYKTGTQRCLKCNFAWGQAGEVSEDRADSAGVV